MALSSQSPYCVTAHTETPRRTMSSLHRNLFGGGKGAYGNQTSRNDRHKCYLRYAPAATTFSPWPRTLVAGALLFSVVWFTNCTMTCFPNHSMEPRSLMGHDERRRAIKLFDADSCSENLPAD